MSSKSLFAVGTLLLAVTTFALYNMYQSGYSKGYLAGSSEVKFITKEKLVEKVVEPQGVITSLTIEDLYLNLKTNYPHISTSDRNAIMTSLAKTADTYNISPLVLYCLISVESSFRWWIEHPTATVEDYDGKKVKTKAIGLGGVVYEIWGKKLKDAGIIETKSDLYTIDRNIASIGFIYSHLKSLALHPKANNPIESGLIRYFGGGYRSYFNKIDAEIASLLRSKVYQ